MARPLRIEFPGAVYHVTSRGDRREPIYVDDHDRAIHLNLIAHAMERFDARVLAYCLMGNHYHLVMQTRQPNLSGVMRHINGVYTQAFNRRHGLLGHLLQGRFKAILVDTDAYLIALCRYVERNPVAANLVAHADDWPWSSHRAHTGTAPTPAWLDSDTLHALLLGRPPLDAVDQKVAAERYAHLIDATDNLWATGLRQQIYLGDEHFVARTQARIGALADHDTEIPKIQRAKPTSLDECLQAATSRDAGIHAAHVQAGISMRAIGLALGLSASRISRIIARIEQEATGKT